MSFLHLMLMISVSSGSLSAASYLNQDHDGVLYMVSGETEEDDTCQVKSSYDIEVIAALPSGRGQVILTSSYSLKISQDEVKSALPYYGRAYGVPYGGGRGLFFSGVPEEYSDLVSKPGQRKISFKVRTDEDLFIFNVAIDFPEDESGDREATAFITVSSGQRQSISYRGRVVR